MGGASSTESRDVVRVQPSRNQVAPIMEASQSSQPLEDAARLRQQLNQEKEEHARALEEAAAANRKRLDEAAAAERLRLDAEAAAERKRLDKEAATQRAQLDVQGAADRKHLDEDAMAARTRLDEEAAVERKRLYEAAAEQRKELDEAAALVRRELDVTAATDRNRLDEDAAVRRTQLDDAAAAKRQQLDEVAAAARKRMDEEAAAERKRLDDEAAAERKRLNEEAAAERRRLIEPVAALQQQLQGLAAVLSAAGPAAIVTSAAAMPRSSGATTVMAVAPAAEPVSMVRAASVPLTPQPPPLGAAGPAEQESQVVDAKADAAAAAAAVAAAEQRRLQELELRRQDAIEAAAAAERRKAEEEVEKNWRDQDLLSDIPANSLQLEELPASILDLHDGMPPALSSAPMRLLYIDSVLSWPNIRVYEEVDTDHEAVVVPYADVDADTWNATIILSWRWDAVKPTEYTRGFAPMSALQFAELSAALQRARSLGMRYVWIDWSCVPQYASSPMVEVLRSKIFYARARAMFVLPTFVAIPAEGIVRLLLVKAMRIIRSNAEGQTASPRSRLVMNILEGILANGRVAGREYFTRVWTLAERMARFGRSERLCHWLSLEVWLGMLVDAMLKSTEDRSASEMYKRLLGRDAGRRLDAILDPLEAAVKTGSMHVSEGLDERVAELFDLAVGIWHTNKELAEVPTKDWLVSYLLDAHSGIYQAWSQADRVWSVYSYFCWKQLDQRNESSLLEALHDLVRVAGGSRRLLMAMATKLGLAKLIPPAEMDKKLITAAAANATEEVLAVLEEGAFPDYPGSGSKTALHFAAEKDNPAAVKMLLKCGANVDVVDVVGATPLHTASENGCAEVIKALVQWGARLEIAKQGGRTALHQAAWAGKEAAVRELLQAGANKDAKDDEGKTPLYLAVINNDTPDVVRVLLEAGVTKTGNTKAGWGVLHAAAYHGNEAVVNLLLHAGMDPNAVIHGEKMFTPLHVAAENGRADAVRALARAGAKVDASGSVGTALHRACVNNHADAVSALLEFRANKEAREPDDKKTPLMVAAHNDSTAALQVLIAAGADVDARDKDNWTPIHFAAKGDSYECCRLLKQAGASTKCKTKGGNYPCDLTKSSRVRGILPDGRGLLEAGGMALFKTLF